MSDIIEVRGLTAANLREKLQRIVVGNQVFHLNSGSLARSNDGWHCELTWIGAGPAASELGIKHLAFTRELLILGVIEELENLKATPLPVRTDELA